MKRIQEIGIIVGDVAGLYDRQTCYLSENYDHIYWGSPLEASALTMYSFEGKEVLVWR